MTARQRLAERLRLSILRNPPTNFEEFRHAAGGTLSLISDPVLVAEIDRLGETYGRLTRLYRQVWKEIEADRHQDHHAAALLRRI